MEVSEEFVKALEEANVTHVICVPDTSLSEVCKKLLSSNKIEYIQATHESDCVGISSGLGLTGRKAFVIMESSGLRTAFETISRFQISHSIHCMYIISNKGSFGERNWWAQAHYFTTKKILNLLNFRYKIVKNIDEFRNALEGANNSFLSNQVSPVIIIDSKFS